MSLRQSLVGLAPTIAYTAVAYPCNILRLWDGPYPFFRVWYMPVWASVLWFVVLLALSFALCQVPRTAARASTKG
jgi:di/tricarboxylate transporter